MGASRESRPSLATHESRNIASPIATILDISIASIYPAKVDHLRSLLVQ